VSVAKQAIESRNRAVLRDTAGRGLRLVRVGSAEVCVKHRRARSPGITDASVRRNCLKAWSRKSRRANERRARLGIWCWWLLRVLTKSREIFEGKAFPAGVTKRELGISAFTTHSNVVRYAIFVKAMHSGHPCAIHSYGSQTIPNHTHNRRGSHPVQPQFVKYYCTNPWQAVPAQHRSLKPQYHLAIPSRFPSRRRVRNISHKSFIKAQPTIHSRPPVLILEHSHPAARGISALKNGLSQWSIGAETYVYRGLKLSC